MLAEVTGAAHEAIGLPLMIEIGVVGSNVLLAIISIGLWLTGREENRRHRAEAQAAHDRHEETIVGGIEAHDERELIRMARLIEKVIDDQKDDREKVVDDGVPNLRSA